MFILYLRTGSMPPPPPPPPARGPPGPPPPPGHGPPGHAKLPTAEEKAKGAETKTRADVALAKLGDALPELPADVASISDADLAALFERVQVAAASAAEAIKLYGEASKLDPTLTDTTKSSKRQARAAERQARDAEAALDHEMQRRAEIKRWSVPDDYSIARCISIATATQQLTADDAAVVEQSLVKPGSLVAYFASHPEIKVAVIDFFAYSCTNCLRTIPGLVALHNKYAQHGLAVIAYHRPEFDFETEAVNLECFVAERKIPYLVGLDNADAAWEAWDVASWPTHVIIERDPKSPPNPDGSQPLRKLYWQGEPAVFVGDLPTNHVQMEAAVAKACGQPVPVPHSDPQRPVDGWEDMEIFVGKEHQFKNVDSGGGCHDGACTIRKLGSEQQGGIVLPLPVPALQKPSLGGGGAHPGYVVYGAEWWVLASSPS